MNDRRASWGHLYALTSRGILTGCEPICANHATRDETQSTSTT